MPEKLCLSAFFFSRHKNALDISCPLCVSEETGLSLRFSGFPFMLPRRRPFFFARISSSRLSQPIFCHFDALDFIWEMNGWKVAIVKVFLQKVAPLSRRIFLFSLPTLTRVTRHQFFASFFFHSLPLQLPSLAFFLPLVGAQKFSELWTLKAATMKISRGSNKEKQRQKVTFSLSAH